MKIAGENSVIATDDIDLSRYQSLGECEVQTRQSPRPISHKYWGGEDWDQLYDSFDQSFKEVQWRGNELLVAELSWATSCGSTSRSWVVAEHLVTAEEFLLDVERKTNDPGKAVMVFGKGNWKRSVDLYQSIEKSSFTDLILDRQVEETIRSDFQKFLDAKDSFHELGLAWRRGAIFVGPPGNGKTHCIRALINALKVPCFYVKSLKSNCSIEENLDTVFERARRLSQSILVFEDLDSLIDASSLSFFLNQLDGFTKNDGMIILATTNHPERIDPALMDRPSRFDRKYFFGMPNEEKRQRFLSQWQLKLNEKTGWSADSVVELAQQTDGFSFAYLKELVVSSMLDWLDEKSQALNSLFSKHLVLLRAQMATKSAIELQTDEN